MNGIDRLLMLSRDNDEAGRLMVAHAPRFLQYKERHLLGTAPQAVTAFNLFQTPLHIARLMAGRIAPHLRQGSRILEPSAGLGRLAEPEELQALRLQWEAVEESRECVAALRQGLKALQATREADFLQLSAEDIGGKVDAIIMNPPFKQGRDIKHIRHAVEMLKTGGRLVALCYNGTRQNEKLKPIADTWEVLPEGSFKNEGTAASVAMLTINK